MTSEVEVRINDIESKIYLIRGEKVMLDHDLAVLYQTLTKRLNEQVRRNLGRFPIDFMFTLSNQELIALRSQIATSKMGRGGRRTPPMAFTEQGVAMLSTVLNSDRAIQVNIAIMRAFVKIRQLVASDREMDRKLAALELKYDGQFKVVFNAIRELMSPKAISSRRVIGLQQKKSK